MITQIKGKLIDLHPTNVVIDCLGIGYELLISLSTYNNLLQKKKSVLLYTRQIIRENIHLLYGFYSKVERKLFDYLISVNGVGPSSAILLLSSLSISEIIEGIISKNLSILQKSKGIGLKTAQRIIIDLHEVICDLQKNNQTFSSSTSKVKIETLHALEVLGIKTKISEHYANLILKKDPSISVEELIKKILKKTVKTN